MYVAHFKYLHSSLIVIIQIILYSDPSKNAWIYEKQ